MLSSDEINRIKEDSKESILAKKNVVGVGVGYKVKGGQRSEDLAVVVLVSQKLPLPALQPEMVLPKIINGVKIDVIEVGTIRALQARTDRWRPAPGGVSIGHYKITAGTFGTIVRDRDTNQRLILSNNHVLANSNDSTQGDPILQPGPIDGGSVDNDTIAQLHRFCPISFNSEPGSCSIADNYARVGNALAGLLGSKHQVQAKKADPQAVNYVDAAVAKPLDEDQVLDEIFEIGTVSGTKEAALGMSVRKSGRTTGFTNGQITLIHATVEVSYGADKTARFENQLVSGPMSSGGDSGSLLVSGDSLQAVGLLFAGSEQSTIFNPINEVLECLEVKI